MKMRKVLVAYEEGGLLRPLAVTGKRKIRHIRWLLRIWRDISRTGRIVVIDRGKRIVDDFNPKLKISPRIKTRRPIIMFDEFK